MERDQLSLFWSILCGKVYNIKKKIWTYNLKKKEAISCSKLWPCTAPWAVSTPKKTSEILTSACLSISCVYCCRSPKRSIMVAMVIVSETDTPTESSRFCKICSVRAGLTFIMQGLVHMLMSITGSDWLKMSMTWSAASCRERKIKKVPRLFWFNILYFFVPLLIS